MTRLPLRVAIVGAGLGGLAAAVALRARGCDVTVYEQAKAFAEVGAGIQVSPNAVKALRALGLEPGLGRFGALPEHHIGRSWRSGRILYRSATRAASCRLFGADFYQVQRSDLHRLLRSALSEETFRLGARCTGARNLPDGALVELADGTQVRCDVVVGADGIHSTVRDCLFGSETPRFTGVICWRGQVPAERLPAGLFGPDSFNWMGPGGCVVHYYVRPGKLVNFVAHRTADVWAEESWSLESDRRELLAAFAGWHPTLQRLFSATERCYKWALFDRDPLPRWSSGRITLLGDAAHPMLPFLAQGGAMAMEDGVILARVLERHAHDVPAALLRYEALRKARATRVQLGSRKRAEVCQVASPLAQLRRNLQHLYDNWFNRGAAIQRADWIYEYDVASIPV